MVQNRGSVGGLFEVSGNLIYMGFRHVILVHTKKTHTKQIGPRPQTDLKQTPSLWTIVECATVCKCAFSRSHIQVSFSPLYLTGDTRPRETRDPAHSQSSLFLTLPPPTRKKPRVEKREVWVDHRCVDGGTQSSLFLTLPPPTRSPVERESSTVG